VCKGGRTERVSVCVMYVGKVAAAGERRGAKTERLAQVLGRTRFFLRARMCLGSGAEIAGGGSSSNRVQACLVVEGHF